MTTVRDPGTGPTTDDELAGRLDEQHVAAALVRKSPADPVPSAVWWRVAEALRASVTRDVEAAVAEVDTALGALQLAVDGLAAPAVVTMPARPGDRQAVRGAQVLVARLLLAPVAASPTLLQVRLARLRDALVAADHRVRSAG